MTGKFFAEYNSVREQRQKIRDARFNGFLLGNVSGMVILLGMIYAAMQFGIKIG